jgi:ABC-2 type transport system permease protein
VLFAILTTSVGMTLGALANCRWIGQLAATGQLDAALALPVPTLSYLLCRRVDPANVGDGLFGLVLFAWMGHPTPTRCVLFALAVVCASAVLTGFLVLTGSLTFVTGPNPASDLGLHALILFSSYPVDIFAGAVKVVLYGVIPAAFVGTVPARLVQHFDPIGAVVLVSVATSVSAAGWAAFRRGLGRYTSGATWTQA